MKSSSLILLDLGRSGKQIASVAALLVIFLGTAACHTVRPDSCSTGRGFKQFNYSSPATADEREAARLLPADVRIAVNMYVVKSYWYDPVLGPSESWRRVSDPADSRIAPIIAVREADRYLLLHVQNVGALDHEFFLVYSRTLKCVVGQFAWYIQG